jgi:hypothetical protein
MWFRTMVLIVYVVVNTMFWHSVSTFTQKIHPWHMVKYFSMLKNIPFHVHPPLIHRWFCTCIVRRLLIVYKVLIDVYLNLMLQKELVLLTLQITRFQWCQCNIEINVCSHIIGSICKLIHLGIKFSLKIVYAFEGVQSNFYQGLY